MSVSDVMCDDVKMFRVEFGSQKSIVFTFRRNNGVQKCMLEQICLLYGNTHIIDDVFLSGCVAVWLRAARDLSPPVVSTSHFVIMIVFE